MDVNGTKFHLLLTRDDWGGCRPARSSESLRDVWEKEERGEDVGTKKFRWDKEKNEITLEKLVFRFTASAKDEKPKLENRRGAARDRYGNWYWIDESGLKIKVLSSGSQNVSDFYPAESEMSETVKKGDFSPVEKTHKPPVAMRGLAVTADHYLVAGTIEPAGLLVFDLFAGGEPSRIMWQAETAFAPYDIAAREACGGVYVLDRENKRYWTLDRGFQAVAEISGGESSSVDDFQPFDGANERRHGVAAPAENFYSEIAETVSPISIEALPDDSVLILDSPETADFSTVYRYVGRRCIDVLKTDSIRSKFVQTTDDDVSPPNTFRLRAFDFAFVGGAGEADDRIFIVSDEGNQAFSFRLICREDLKSSPPPELPPRVMRKNLELQATDEYYPMRLYSGKGFVAAGGRVFYDFGDRWLALVNQNRPLYVESGSLVTEVFDGKEPHCVWHRLIVDGCLPSETKLEIYSRSADEKEKIDFGEWRREPDLYLRSNGSELPFAERRTSKENGSGSWELLFQNARQRFLQLRLDFSGNGQRTPRLSAMRIYYPRFSYLDHYLPAVYRDDEQSASFLERFLANFEGFYTSIEDRIAAVEMLFDVRSAPADALEWLADWLGVALDPAWSEAKRRLFISRAVDFFQYRGTLRGLRIALRLALDECADESIFEPQTGEQKRRDPIRIVERFQTRLVPEIIPPDTVGDENFPRVTSKTGKWNPSQGVDALHQRYGEMLGETAQFPLAPPADDVAATKWLEFSRQVLGFMPNSAAVNELAGWRNILRDKYHNQISQLNAAHKTNYPDAAGDDFLQIFLPIGNEANEEQWNDWRKFLEIKTDASRIRRRWQDFLARRYRRIGQLNSDYRTNWGSFEEVALFDRLPLLGKPLTDWFQFESGVMPMHATAHQFTVLIPATLQGKRIADAETQKRQLDLVERIVKLEKPAHTTFDYRFYWNLFRLDEVRLGLDTLLGLGSRDPMLNPDLVVGQSFVGESRIGAAPTERYVQRYVLGSNGLKQKKDGEK